MKWWPFSKKKPQEKRSYQAAQFNRLVSDWISSTTSANAEIKGNLKTLRNRSRDLDRNNDWVKQFHRSVQNNIIGQGIWFQSQVKMQRGNKLNDALNTEIEKAFERWARKDSCDAYGQLSLQEMARVAVRSVARDGDIFVRKMNRAFGSSKVPFALELIEADFLADDYQGRADNGNVIKLGIEYNEFNRVVAYHFYTNHPGDTSVMPVTGDRRIKRVPAEEIIPLFVSDRANQGRGVPWLTSSMLRLHHIQGYEEAEVVGARGRSALMGFITSPEGQVHGDDVVDTERVYDFEPGVFKYLNSGEKVEVPNLGNPSQNFNPFMQAQLRGVAAGAGVSYETISRDFSNSNYSSARISLLDERDNWRVLQDWIVNNFYQPIFEAWLDMAYLSGALTLPGYELTPEKYQCVKWMPRGWAWIDPMKEVEATVLAIENNLTSRSKVLAQQGEDFDDLADQIEREKQVLDDKGIAKPDDAQPQKPPMKSSNVTESQN